MALTAWNRFWGKVSFDGVCWEWMAGRNTSGYGVFAHERTDIRKAHRYAYELLVGPIPGGLVLDHLCRNRLCVNPDHLEPVTAAENFSRGIYGKPGALAGGALANRLKVACLRGHPFTEDNTIRRGAKRKCRTCTNAQQRARRLRRKEAA